MTSAPDSQNNPAEPEETPSLLAMLLKQPQRFEFFHAVRILDQYFLCRKSDGRATDKNPRRNRTGPKSFLSSDKVIPGTQKVRFRSTATLDFPQGAISQINIGDEKGATAENDTGESVTGEVSVETNHFGLTGPSGTLPRHYHDLIIDRLRRFKDHALHDFLDIVTHRFTVLLCQAWSKYRGQIAYENESLESPKSPHEELHRKRSDPVSESLVHLTGIGTEGLSNRQSAPDHAVLYHAGNFLRKPCTAESLRKIINDVFLLPVEIIPFTGGWLTLEHDDRTHLASTREPSGFNAALGQTAIIGSRVWDSSSAFEVRLGPLALEDFEDLLPGGSKLPAIGDLIRFTVGLHYTIQIRLVLRCDRSPQCQLGASGTNSSPKPQLGWTTWLAHSQDSETILDDAIFTVAQ